MKRVVAAVGCVLGITAMMAPVAQAGPSGGAQHPSLIRSIEVAGKYGIPDDAEVVAFNLTAVDAGGQGRLTAFPCDAPEVPDVSNLNYLEGDIIPNFVLSRIADDGTVCIYTHALTDVIVDVVGYVPAGSAIVPLSEPQRFYDSRDAGPVVPAGGTVTVDITGHPDVPDNADVVMFNLTAVGASTPGHARVHACDTARPTSSALNYVPGRATANFTTSRIAPNGTICIWALNATHLIVDVVAYATDGIIPLRQPIRVRDTRTEATPQPGSTLTVRLDDHLPANATAALYNLTAADPQARGFATSYPCDQPRPIASNLNYRPGRNVAASTITALSGDRTICIFSRSTTDYVVDLTAYTTSTAHYTPLPNPTRALDTREGWQATCDWVFASTSDLNGDVTFWVDVLNVKTGQFRRFSHDAIGPSDAIGTPFVRQSCDAVVVLTEDGALATFGFDGSKSKTPLPLDLSLDPVRDVHEANGQVLVSRQNGALFDAETGAEIWSGTPQPIDRITVSDTLIVAVSYRPPGSPVQVVEIWDAQANQKLTTFDLRDERDLIDRLDASPDGTYILLDIDRLGASPPAYGNYVITQYGDVVDGVDAPVLLDAGFLGDGELWLWADMNGWYRWELYGGIDKSFDWPVWKARYG